MEPDGFHDLVAVFTRKEPPRVWSLIVSIFGDLAQSDGAGLDGVTIGRITRTIGIRPEATRVALHRLRKEGWLLSKRTGRTSTYALTAHGLSETLAAAPRIYSADPPAQTAWLVLSQQTSLPGATTVSAGIHITSEPPLRDDVLIRPLIAGAPIPDWMRARVCQQDLIDQTVQAVRILQCAREALAGMQNLSALETVVLRVLVVHTWRRILLRSPCLPDHVFPDTWKGQECRLLACELLSTLKVPSEEELRAEATPSAAARVT